MWLPHFVILALVVAAVSAFVAPISRAVEFPSDRICGIKTSPFVVKDTAFLPHFIQRQRKSVTSVQTAGLFGLGFPEIAIILVAGVFVLGPEKISEMMRSSGQVAGKLKDELREVPSEFKKGLEEGEINARASKARKIDPIPNDE